MKDLEISLNSKESSLIVNLYFSLINCSTKFAIASGYHFCHKMSVWHSANFQHDFFSSQHNTAHTLFTIDYTHPTINLSSTTNLRKSINNIICSIEYLKNKQRYNIHYLLILTTVPYVNLWKTNNKLLFHPG